MTINETNDTFSGLVPACSSMRRFDETADICREAMTEMLALYLDEER